MLKTDRHMLKEILSMTKDPNVDLDISGDHSKLLIVRNISNVERSQPIKKVKPDFVIPSIIRLIDAGYLCYGIKYHGGFNFSITDLALLRCEIFWENFTKKFWYGFASGVLTGVTVSILGYLITKGLSSMGL